MGMIMKDGIPYGGIYPIDDAPTQGSNNAVKSGGVHSALSNKVDKVAGKGLSTNDYSDTEKGKVAALPAMQNVLGTKNVYNVKDISGTHAGLTVVMNDDKSITFRAGTSTNNSNHFIYLNPQKLEAGEWICSGGLSSSEYGDKLVLVKHGWAGVYDEDVPFIADGVSEYGLIAILIYPNITLSKDVTFYPMIRPAGTDSTYVKPAMTNAELTDAVNRGSVSVTGDGVKTYRQLLNELYSKIEFSRITKDSCLLSVGSWGYVNYQPDNINDSMYVFASTRVSVSTGIYIESVEIKQNDSVFALYYNGNTEDRTDFLAQASFIFYY